MFRSFSTLFSLCITNELNVNGDLLGFVVDTYICFEENWKDLN